MLQIMLRIIRNAILKRHVQNFTPSSLYGFQLQSSWPASLFLSSSCSLPGCPYLHFFSLGPPLLILLHLSQICHPDSPAKTLRTSRHSCLKVKGPYWPIGTALYRMILAFHFINMALSVLVICNVQYQIRTVTGDRTCSGRMVSLSLLTPPAPQKWVCVNSDSLEVLNFCMPPWECQKACSG